MNESEIASIIARTNDALEKAGRPAIAFDGTARTDGNAGLARYFDHTLLKPEATEDRYRALCDEAVRYGTRSVCVPPDRVALCAELVSGTDTEVCTVIGFPLGYHSSSAKVAEVEMAASQGATEFDMVIPVGRMRDGDPTVVYDDVRAVVAAADGKIVKVILETALLDETQKVQAAAAAVRAGAAILKTSTGFASAGATIEDLRMFRIVAGQTRGVKASGGVRDLAFTKACIEAGVDRVGASATVAILEEAAGRTDASQSKGGDGY